VSLFHDRQVGAEVGVEDGFEAHSTQRGVCLTGEIGADREAECLADGDTDGRGELGHAEGVRVEELVPDFLGVVVLNDRAGRAVSGALAAANAWGVRQADVAGRSDAGVDAALQEGEGPDVLDLLADLDAAAAADALARVQDDGPGRLVDGQVGNDAVESDVANPEVGGDRLEFAVLVSAAGQALVRVLLEDHLDY
jgi:hypothetical protein